MVQDDRLQEGDRRQEGDERMQDAFGREGGVGVDELPEDLRGVSFDSRGLKGLVPWYVRWLMRVSPRFALSYLATRMGIGDATFERAHEALAAAERVDLHPLNGERGRGFMLVLDRGTAFYFYQDGDAFQYDGYEFGEYEPGNVRIFDGRYAASEDPVKQRFAAVKRSDQEPGDFSDFDSEIRK